MSKLVVFPQLCSGCRICEVVCSYYHTGAFNREKASIHIRRVEREGFFEINMLSTCDRCNNEDQPLCVKFCSMYALKLEEE